MKECSKCHTLKPLEDFYRQKGARDRLMSACKECNKKKVAEYQKSTGYESKRNHYNFKRIFRQRYRSMMARVDGRNTRKNGKKLPVYGKEILPLKDFLEWCHDPDVYKSFETLHKAWEESGFTFKLCPSIDRIDNNKGYIVGNLQWLSHIDNRIKSNK